eukprot:1236123-Amphidinium_carterae.1
MLITHGAATATDQLWSVRTWLRSVSIALSTWSSSEPQYWASLVGEAQKDHDKWVRLSVTDRGVLKK